MSRKAAIIVAGGKGLRMGGDVPKQYLPILGEPVLAHTVRAYEKSSTDEIVLVIPRGDVVYVWEEIVDRYGFEKVTAVVEGGAERFDSVYEGLLALKDSEPDLVAIHDGARPVITTALIENAYDEAAAHGGAAAAVAVKDTIRFINADGTAGDTLDRGQLRAMQTPQTFRFAPCIPAYERMLACPGGTDGITDDVMVMQRFGNISAKLIPGDYKNIKITTAEDLETAEEYLSGI